jgi:hypothetical protein
MGGGVTRKIVGWWAVIEGCVRIVLMLARYSSSGTCWRVGLVGRQASFAPTRRSFALQKLVQAVLTDEN